MPRIGVHVSTAGGIDKAPERAAALGCETMQIFTRSPQGGPAPQLSGELISKFKSQSAKFAIQDVVIHTPYYINFASLNPKIKYASIKVVREELERGSSIGASFVMMHVGSHAKQTLEKGIAVSRESLKKTLVGYQGTTELLLEMSAGAGSVLGDTFEELAQIMDGAENMHGFGGVCFDTCHAFASGYDFTTLNSARNMLKEFDHAVGLQYLKLSHVNDSMFGRGEHKDRHEHIGHGKIGKEGLAALLRQKEFMGIDWILETEDEGREKDVQKLKGIRKE